MVKKCNCKKCVYCKQIIISRVNCEKYGDDNFIPSHCDQYTTKEDYEIQLQAKIDYEFQKKCLEYVWTIVNRGGK